MSMVVAQESSPSHLGRAQWLAEEVMASAGLELCVLRIAAMFHENIALLHRKSIREQGLIRNCFGDAKAPWIAGDDAGELMVAALLHPERFGEATICYPSGAEALSHTEIAEVLTQELGRPIHYEAVSVDAWREELLELARGGSPALNADMARHISTVGAALSQRVGASKPPAPTELAQQIGRVPKSFRDYVRARRSDLGL
jgi:uncharacterized protein YbjT (DUF2867 family)